MNRKWEKLNREVKKTIYKEFSPAKTTRASDSKDPAFDTTKEELSGKRKVITPPKKGDEPASMR